jgi:SpoVK/Ycf46/Vps4 family AAA+-type ATPase
VIIGTTNRPDMLDPALLRRFDEQIFFPPPSLAQLNQLMQRLCEYYRVPEIHVGDCENFDAATKKVRTEARRAVMRELLKSDEANEEETDNGTDEEEANEEARDRANSKGNNSSGKGSKPGRPR